MLGVTRYVIPLVLIISAMLSIMVVTQAQPSESEAKSAFEKLGCTSCHNGGVAKRWEDIVSNFKGYGSRYASLDEAIKAEVTYFGQRFNSFDELMKTMASNVGRQPGDPQVGIVRSYLEYLFNLGRTMTPPATTTPTPTTPPVTTTTTPEVTGVRGGERLTWGVVLAALAIAIIVLGALIVGLIVVRH